MVEVAWSIGAFGVSVFLASKIRRSVGPIMHDLWLIALMVFVNRDTLAGLFPNAASHTSSTRYRIFFCVDP